MSKRKMLLIQPSPYDRDRKPIKKRKIYFVGLALPLLAAMTPDEWEVELCLETIEDVPLDTDAELIGISSMGHGVIRSIDLAKEFKKRGKTVVMGGYMVSLMPEEVIQYCDSVLIGDAEDVWHDLLSDYAAGSLKQFYRSQLETLRTPLPRYDLVLDKSIGDFLPVQAGRGCPNGCSFCSIHCLYRGRYLQRPVSDVMRDIRAVKELGFRKFLLLDDNILSEPAYLEELCREIRKLDMRWLSQCSIELARNDELLRLVADSGCITLSFGLESISSESLASMGKGWADPADYPELIAKIQAAGIDVSTEMVIGADGDTLESIDKTADFIRQTGIVLPRFYILTPIPGTDLHKQFKAQGRLCNDDIYSYDGTEAVHVPAQMTAGELTEAYWKLYDKVFSMGGILSRTLFRSDFFRKPARYLFYFAMNLLYRAYIKRRIAPNIY